MLWYFWLSGMSICTCGCRPYARGSQHAFGLTDYDVLPETKLIAVHEVVDKENKMEIESEMRLLKLASITCCQEDP